MYRKSTKDVRFQNRWAAEIQAMEKQKAQYVTNKEPKPPITKMEEGRKYPENVDQCSKGGLALLTVRNKC